MPVDDTEFTLRDDVNSLVETAVETDNLIGLYKTATADGIENITQENLTALIDSTKALITKCENTGFVNALSKYILPLAYDIMIENKYRRSLSCVLF